IIHINISKFVATKILFRNFMKTTHIINTLSNNKNTQQIIYDPLNDNISSVELVRVSGSDLDIVNAARVSYGKISTEVTERDKKLIAFLREHNHTSTFEHNQLSLLIK